MAPRRKKSPISATANDFDRISHLPSEIIDQILELLPIKDAIRMSVSSRQWRYKWVMLPKLKLDEAFFSAILNHTCLCDQDRKNTSLCESTISPDEFARIELVDRLLLSHVGPIHDLSIYLPHWFPWDADISDWIQFVSGRSVKELTLFNHHRRSSLSRAPKMKLPSSLFSGVGFNHLLHLTILGSFDILTLPANFKGFPSLTRLKVQLLNPREGRVHETSNNGLESLVSKCLQLEILELLSINPKDCLIIRAPKRLHTLIILGCYSRICLDELNNVKELRLLLVSRPEWDKTRLTELFSCLTQVELLSLSGEWMIMDNWLANVGPSGKLKPHPELRRLKHLIVGEKLDSQFMSFFLCLFRMAPRLEKLKIGNDQTFEQSSDIMTVEEDCRLNHLKMAEVICYYHVASKLVKLILSASPALEVLTICTTLQAEEQLKEDISQFDRASATVEIIFKIIERVEFHTLS